VGDNRTDVRSKGPELDQLMSLIPCTHDSRQRSIDVTCGERCESFPECLPPASPQVRGRISSMFQAGAVERDAIEALLATLEAVLQDESPL
jgi:hypothetical protein